MTRSPMISQASPLARLLQLQDALEDTSRFPRGWFASSLTGRGTFPLVNILRDERSCVLRFEVPGLDPGAISVESQGRTLTVSGKRSHEGAPGSLHRNERWSGEFERSIELPADLQPSEATADYRNGVLTVRVPLREEAKPRAITVNAD